MQVNTTGRSKKKVLCMFCGRRESKAEEHGFARQQFEPLGMTNEELVFNKWIFGSDTLVHVLSYKVSRFVYEKVCSDCNNVWMNDLEKAVTPWLQEVWSTKNVRLLLDESKRLSFARWAVKSACVFDRLLGMNEIAPEIPRQLEADRNSVPSGISVLVGWHPVQFPEYLFTVQKNAWTKREFRESPQPCPDITCEQGSWFKVAFRVYGLMVVVASVPPHWELVTATHQWLWPTTKQGLGFCSIWERTEHLEAEEALTMFSDSLKVAHRLL